ncbi:MAG: hypothetical protein COB09_10405 [Thalassobium sp.]|jgi:hypothetical protein|uniref:Uncharacterized protein n=1 Tax=Thalassolituus pacificus TaxID=2975440 RepID=A0A9X2WD05_9GAMM|nr:hypothetical protein [Thalassolituus pacificus]MCT7358153.1 hypothetical protein [Thalassolituus pacificus]PHS63647.1 MAG: hypothetical protein COB09_10405 [Thalassobium sp.]
MLIENTSDLIVRLEQRQLPSGINVDLAALQNGTVLAISADALALYRSFDAVGDALGNGLIASVTLPHTLPAENDRLVLEHRAGYVGLAGGFVLLITLNDVQLFGSKEDALRNRNEIARLSLAH